MTIICPEIKYKDLRGMHHDGFYMDNLAMQVAETIVARVKERNQDTLLIMNGREGSGKSNAAIVMAYYISKISGRSFTNANIFFDMKDMMKFAGSTKEQIILWDEGALGGLANDWTNEAQKKLNAFLMVCRKLKHIFIFCIPRFYRLSPNIIERAHVMLHMFEDNNEKPGNFIIIGQQSIEELYTEWRSTRRANYFGHKKAPPGHFSFVMPYLIDNDAYEDEKSAAIAKLAGVIIKAEPKAKTRDDYMKIAWEKNKLNKKKLSKVEFAALFGISDTQLNRILVAGQESTTTEPQSLYNPIEQGQSGGDGGVSTLSNNKDDLGLQSEDKVSTTPSDTIIDSSKPTE